MKIDHTQKRFPNFISEPGERLIHPPADHPAVVEGHTIYRGNVVEARDLQRLLVSGHNNRKIGKMVRKGPWSGMPIYTLTLEERATCPRTCHVWRECYGNSMHWPRRIRHNASFEMLLSAEVVMLAKRHPEGFVVRLHVLGDFYSEAYAARWLRLLDENKELHIFGYTAHFEYTEIGATIAAMNNHFPDRCVIRWSRPADFVKGMDATVWDSLDTVPGPTTPRVNHIICPVDTDRTMSCGDCGLCWSPAARDKTIVFIKHGRRARQ